MVDFLRSETFHWPCDVSIFRSFVQIALLLAHAVARGGVAAWLLGVGGSDGRVCRALLLFCVSSHGCAWRRVRAVAVGCDGRVEDSLGTLLVLFRSCLHPWWLWWRGRKRVWKICTGLALSLTRVLRRYGLYPHAPFNSPERVESH